MNWGGLFCESFDSTRVFEAQIRPALPFGVAFSAPRFLSELFQVSDVIPIGHLVAGSSKTFLFYKRFKKNGFFVGSGSDLKVIGLVA